jgi:hypothetical protein
MKDVSFKWICCFWFKYLLIIQLHDNLYGRAYDCIGRVLIMIILGQKARQVSRRQASSKSIVACAWLFGLEGSVSVIHLLTRRSLTLYRLFCSFGILEHVVTISIIDFRDMIS